MIHVEEMEICRKGKRSVDRAILMELLYAASCDPGFDKTRIHKQYMAIMADAMNDTAAALTPIAMRLTK